MLPRCPPTSKVVQKETVRGSGTCTGYGVEIDDYTWRAPIDTMTCWDKAHKFYLPRGLFKIRNSPPLVADTLLNSNVDFAHIAIGSDLYKRKNKVMGLQEVQRGQKWKGPKPTVKWNTRDSIVALKIAMMNGMKLL